VKWAWSHSCSKTVPLDFRYRWSVVPLAAVVTGGVLFIVGFLLIARASFERTRSRRRRLALPKDSVSSQADHMRSCATRCMRVRSLILWALRSRSVRTGGCLRSCSCSHFWSGDSETKSTVSFESYRVTPTTVGAFALGLYHLSGSAARFRQLCLLKSSYMLVPLNLQTETGSLWSR
jgi:hypothetical protein